MPPCRGTSLPRRHRRRRSRSRSVSRSSLPLQSLCSLPRQQRKSPAPVQEHPADPVLTKAPQRGAAGHEPLPVLGGRSCRKLEGIDPNACICNLRKSKAYFDGTRVLIDGGKTFRDFIRANKDSQRLIKKLIKDVSGTVVPIGPYEPKSAGKTVSNAEQSLRALEKLGLDVSIEDSARKTRS